MCKSPPSPSQYNNNKLKQQSWNSEKMGGTRDQHVVSYCISEAQKSGDGVFWLVGL